MRSVFVIDVFSSGMIQENEMKYVSYHNTVNDRRHKFVDMKKNFGQKVL